MKSYKLLAALSACVVFALYGGALLALENNVIKNNTPFTMTPKLWLEVEGGLSIQWVSHGHKKTRIDGPSSPLLVAMKYQLNGDVFDVQHAIYPHEDGSARWIWSNYTVDLIEYVYGKSMTIRIYKTEAETP